MAVKRQEPGMGKRKCPATSRPRASSSGVEHPNVTYTAMVGHDLSTGLVSVLSESATVPFVCSCKFVEMEYVPW